MSNKWYWIDSSEDLPKPGEVVVVTWLSGDKVIMKFAKISNFFDDNPVWVDADEDNLVPTKFNEIPLTYWSPKPDHPFVTGEVLRKEIQGKYAQAMRDMNEAFRGVVRKHFGVEEDV